MIDAVVIDMLQILLFISIEIIKIECVGHYQKRVGARLRNLKKKEKGLGGRCRLMKVQLAILQNVGNVQNMKSIFQFHCFMLFQMRPVYIISTWPHWFGQLVQIQYWQSQLINTQTCKPGPGLPKDIIYKIMPIFIFRAK